MQPKSNAHLNAMLRKARRLARNADERKLVDVRTAVERGYDEAVKAGPQGHAANPHLPLSPLSQSLRPELRAANVKFKKAQRMHGNKMVTTKDRAAVRDTWTERNPKPGKFHNRSNAKPSAVTYG